MPKQKKESRKMPSGSYVLGRERFSQISAVEGIHLTAAMLGRATEFERSKLAPGKRRLAIIGAYRKQ